MIQTTQTIAIAADIHRIWDYVKDIGRWANLVPGCRECAVISERESRWIVKVGVGGLVRTVTVLVHVDQWSGPERVDFSYQLEGDPVVGTGCYVAMPQPPSETGIALTLRVEGSGSMAPMWEALCRPLLPQLAKSFAGKLKAEIEGDVE